MEAHALSIFSTDGIITETTAQFIEPWLRQHNEPIEWYERFQKFMLLGTSRDLATIYIDVTGKKGAVPHKWIDVYDLWKWKSRAEAWDEAELSKDRIAEEKSRKEAREQRRDMLNAFYDKTLEAIALLEPEEASWKSITAAFRVLIQEIRAEYDELPTQRIQETKGYDTSAEQDARNELLARINHIVKRDTETTRYIEPTAESGS